MMKDKEEIMVLLLIEAKTNNLAASINFLV